jgi:hypothetical protein
LGPLCFRGERVSISTELAPGLAGEGRVDEVGDLGGAAARRPGPYRRVTPGRPRS